MIEELPPLPEGVFVEDYFQCAVGWKVLKIEDIKFPKVTGNHQTSHVWYPRKSYEPMKAVCCPNARKPSKMEEHEPPAPSGMHPSYDCGIYGYFRMEEAIAREYPKVITRGSNRVVVGVKFIAVVEGGGNLWVHQSASDGWRAEYCRLAAFVRPVEDLNGAEEPVHTLLQSIALKLGLPYLDRDEAQEFATTLGVDLTPEE